MQRMLSASFFLIAFTPLASSIATAQTIEAFFARPFGVARLQVRLPAGVPFTAITVRSREARVFYPSFGPNTANGRTPGTRTTIHFLFQGIEPFSVEVRAGQRVTNVPVRPRRPIRRQLTRATNRWWRAYNATLRRIVQQGDYPPTMQNYLVSMLGYRLRLRPPLLSRLAQAQQTEVQRTLELLAGAESLRDRVVRNTFTTGTREEKATITVPSQPRWVSPYEEADVKILPRTSKLIEPIAWRVPRNCFYVRFGRFSNFVWLEGLLNQYGGDISRMITMRGHDRPYTQRLQDQLAMKQSALAKLLGDQVIADMALIGQDMFVREGAAMGVLLQAHNNALLLTDLVRRRQGIAASVKGATLKPLKISGHPVTFLSTADNRIRSFLVSDENFHLVTNSRNIVKLFLQTRRGKSLGSTREFQFARHRFPLTRQDTLFAYFSSAFLHGLVTPQYQIELMRRLESVSDMEVARLTELVAKNEGLASDSIDDWVSHGLVPQGFGARPDGSGIVLSDKVSLDSLRGARGYFLPIPDVPLGKITATEAKRYQQIATYYRQHWKQMDPVMVGVKRFALNRKGLERVVIDANISPLEEQKYGWIMSILGPPNKVRIQPAPGDIIHFQAHLTGGKLSRLVPPHQLFVGIQDTAVRFDASPTSFFKVVRLLQSTPGYIGGWPKPGFVDWLPLPGVNRVDPEGYSRFLFGVWRRQWDAFSVLSFQRPVLEKVTPFIRPTKANDLAQVRLHVGDLAHSKLKAWLNHLSFKRSQQTSEGNIRLLEMTGQQFGVATARSKTHVEQVLGTKLLCALGGKYAIDQQGTWRSTANSSAGLHHSPLLQWFRGAEASLTKTGDRVIMRATIDMQRQPGKSNMTLPLLKIFGNGKPARVSKKPPKKPQPKKRELE